MMILIHTYTVRQLFTLLTYIASYYTTAHASYLDDSYFFSLSYFLIRLATPPLHYYYGTSLVGSLLLVFGNMTSFNP